MSEVPCQSIWTRKITVKSVARWLLRSSIRWLPLLLAIALGLWAHWRANQLNTELEALKSKPFLEIVEESGTLPEVKYGSNGLIQLATRHAAPPKGYILDGPVITFETVPPNSAHWVISVSKPIAPEGFRYHVQEWRPRSEMIEVKWKARWLVVRTQQPQQPALQRVYFDWWR